jgi:N-acetyl-beta-hexosaminidase
MAFSRLPGIAEIGWSPRGVRDWNEYRWRLAGQGPRWEAQGVNLYRSPQGPGLKSAILRVTELTGASCMTTLTSGITPSGRASANPPAVPPPNRVADAMHSHATPRMRRGPPVIG